MPPSSTRQSGNLSRAEPWEGLCREGVTVAAPGVAEAQWRAMTHLPTGAVSSLAQLQLVDWRRRVAVLYEGVRAQTDPARGHALWRHGRDELMREHPQTPLLE